MRILRGSGPPLRVVVTAGNRIAATPPSLSQRQRRLYRARARESFGEVLQHALRNEADLLISAGGLWGATAPEIDDLRLITRWAQRLADHGVAIVALDDASPAATSERATALAYLAELGLLHAVAPDPAGGGVTLSLRGTSLAFAAEMASPADTGGAGSWRILLASDPATASVVEERLAAADIVILGDRPEAAHQAAGRSLLVRPGWSAPPLARTGADPGFTYLEIDDGGVRRVEFVPLAEAAPVQVGVPAESLPAAAAGVALRQRLEAEAGSAGMVTVQLTGAFDREFFHGLKLRDLVDAQSHVVLAVDLSRSNVAGAGLPGERRPSFVVEARRAAEHLARSDVGGAADEARHARGLVLAAFQRTGEKERPA
ncbi:MAG: hypothetical protein FJ029_08070 [Actinobacteria bacterium]|nr:hypothetical protein [Actinomycetota bacterium]